jgi:hypothetical protein
MFYTHIHPYKYACIHIYVLNSRMHTYVHAIIHTTRIYAYIRIYIRHACIYIMHTYKQTNFVALSPQANYTDWVTATWRNLVPNLVDRGVLNGQRGGSPTVVNLSFLDRSRYFSFE